jgi:hypothetical protein
MWKPSTYESFSVEIVNPGPSMAWFSILQVLNCPFEYHQSYVINKHDTTFSDDVWGASQMQAIEMTRRSLKVKVFGYPHEPLELFLASDFPPVSTFSQHSLAPNQISVKLKSAHWTHCR